MKTIIYISILCLLLGSCSEQRDYSNPKNVQIGEIDVNELLVVNENQNWIEILEVYPAINNCEKEVNADLYIGILDQVDTVQIIVPCSQYLHTIGTHALLFKQEKDYNGLITFANDSGKLNNSYLVIVADILIPID